ncbi:MAG: hypothetical protein KGJ86_09620, partial [Chloroflexota bacterium]|nr:hypothetical protein [Chloroflexota bacterium]
MRLTLQQCDVHGVDWGGQTRLENGILTIDRGSLASQLLLDERVIGVDLEFARPGESCRIAPVFDVVEPRAKLEPRGFDFPGALTKVAPVGDGTTRVLRGAAVTVVGESSDARRLTDATSNVSPETAPQQRRERASVGHVIDFHSRPIEGFGPMEFSRYAALHHLVVMPRFAAGVEGDSRKNALRVAGLRAASHLASSVQVAAPDEEQTFELTPASEELPRVAYVYQLHSHQVPTVPGEPLLYGDNCRHLLPTILHPNEILDGAVVRSYHHLNMETYDIQNHGLILDLYRRHGREL